MADKTINISIEKEPLSIDNCYQFVLEPSCGGIDLFVGTVRNINKGKAVTHLEFETYHPMAIKELTKIAEEAIDTFNIKKIAMHHREGHVGIKEIAVIIAVSSTHRKNAFDACAFAINQLKERVPIWKKEYLEDGSYWVNARP